MSKQPANSLFMFSPLAVKQTELYQQLLKGVGDFSRLGNLLIELGEQANAFRDFDKVREIGQILFTLPVRNFQSVGYYFLAIAANSKGSGDQEEAGRLFEVAADTATEQYKAKAILGMAAVSLNKSNFESGFYYYREAIKAGRLSATSLEALRGMAVLKGFEGYHGHALTDLDKFLPVARQAPANIYFNYLNSYAVELCEIGRLEEAKRVSSIVVSSPLVQVYPEWQETFAEVDQKLYKSRSRVTVSIPEPKPVAKTEPVPVAELVLEPEHVPIPEQSQARILKFPQPKPSEIRGEVTVALTPIQWLAVVLKVMLTDRITDQEVERICSSYYELITDFYN